MLEEYIDRDGWVGVNQTDSNMASLRHYLLVSETFAGFNFRLQLKNFWLNKFLSAA